MSSAAWVASSVVEVEVSRHPLGQMDQSIDRGRRPEFPERPRHVLVSLVPIGKGQRQKRRQMIVGESELEAHDQRELHVNGIAASYGVPQKVEAQPRAVGNPELPKELELTLGSGAPAMPATRTASSVPWRCRADWRWWRAPGGW